MPMDIRAALKEGMARLRAAKVPSHTLAAELLLMSALGRDRTWMYTHHETVVEPQILDKYFALIARRAAGEPTQYLTGKQEFWGLEFEVRPGVLIPGLKPSTWLKWFWSGWGREGSKSVWIPGSQAHVYKWRI